VVRLKSGDPAIFAHGAEELERLAREGIEFEIVPGITAALAAGSRPSWRLARGWREPVLNQDD